jgi:glyoxylate reductase
MKKPLVVLNYPHPKDLIDSILKPVARVSIATSNTIFKKQLKKADGLVTLLTTKVDEKLLVGAPKLKAVGNVAVGLDNVDLEACKKRNIAVFNTPKVLNRATAELTLALILSVARRIPEGENLVRSGRFKGWAPDLLLGQLLKGRRAVVVGKGQIGKEAGRLLNSFGIQVSFITKDDTPGAILSKLRKAQILTLHIPHQKQTHHWLDAKKIKHLPHDAIVINTSRGPVIEEKALIKALTNQKIFGAGLDVFENEPKVPLALRKLPNVTLLPHLGSSTLETRRAMAALAMKGVARVLQKWYD